MIVLVQLRVKIDTMYPNREESRVYTTITINYLRWGKANYWEGQREEYAIRVFLTLDLSGDAGMIDRLLFYSELYTLFKKSLAQIHLTWF